MPNTTIQEPKPQLLITDQSLYCMLNFKVLECFIYGKCIEFIEPTLSSSQFVFLRKCSTVQQLLLFINNIYETAYTSFLVEIIYLDFVKLSTAWHILEL